MTPHLSVLVVFSSVIGLNLAVLFAILFFRKNNTLSNKLLGILILLAAHAVIANSLMYTGHFAGHTMLWYANSCVAFVFGPCLILYLHLMEGKAYHFEIRHLIHFFPIGLILLYGFHVAAQPHNIRVLDYESTISGKNPIVNLIYLGQLLHFAVYITWGIRKVKKYRKQVEHFFTGYEEVNYNWMWFFVTRLLVLNILLGAVYAFQISLFPAYIAYTELIATPLASFGFYLLVFFKSFSNHLIFDKEGFEKLVEKCKPLAEIPIDKNKKNDAYENLDQLHAIKERLDILLKEDKVYTTPQLSVHKLADRIGCGRTVLSQAINRLYGSTFFELVNNYRVEEVKELLMNPQYAPLKIESIGEMAGFSSRAGFFSVFKKMTGLSPSQYRALKTKQKEL